MKFHILFYVTLICILLTHFNNTNAQTPKAFYVGHSLSDQIPDMVQSLSNDHSEVDFSWVYQSIPGAPLRWQWERLYAQDYYPIDPHYYGFYDETHGLAAGDFDILVLTESVPRYWDIIEDTYQYADSFFNYAMAYNANLRVYLYEDWHCILSGTPTACDYDIDSNPWRQRLTDDLPMWESVVDTLNARYHPDVPVCLIPAGQGLAALYDSIQIGAMPDISSINDIFSDNIHLNDVGKYYVACIHFAMIHETSPVGLTNQLQVWWGGNFEAPSPALALKFQEMAWTVVNNYPNSCLTTTNTGTRVQVQANLQGAYNFATNNMVTHLLSNELLPLNQPFNTAPWFYNGAESLSSASDFPTSTVDWVLLEARNGVNGSTIVEQRAALLLADGTVVDAQDFGNVRLYNITAGTPYYIAIKARGHLAVISSNVVLLPNTNPMDFTNPAFVAGGADQLSWLNGTNYALSAGDYNNDGIITVSDFNTYLPQASGVNVYHPTDGNMDGNISISDFNLYQSNASKIGVQQIRY